MKNCKKQENIRGKTKGIGSFLLPNSSFRRPHTGTRAGNNLGTALRQYVNIKKHKNIKDLRGKIVFKSDYDYKAMRVC